MYFTNPSIDLFHNESSNILLCNNLSTSSSSGPIAVMLNDSGCYDDLTHNVPPIQESEFESSLVNTTPLRRSTRISQLPSYLRNCHCYSTIFSLHEINTFQETKYDPL